MEVLISKKDWLKFTEAEMQQYKDEVFSYYRNVRGFPFYPTDKESRDHEWDKLSKYDISTVLEGDVIKQTMHGLALAWSYFPHSWSVKCNNFKTPYDIFFDDVLFKKVIEKRLKIGDYMSDSGIRKMLKIFTGVQCVSNFRPSAAAAIYNKYAGDGVVWDMSGGFGGRLLGASRCKLKKYIATDPSTKTFEGLCELNADYGNPTYEIHKLGSEDYHPAKESLDLCFTSPPYFDTEKYSDEGTQSFNKFSNQTSWRDGFLKQTFENCYVGLKKDRFMLINIANVKTYKNLEIDTIETARRVGFTYIETLKLVLSSMTTSKNNIKFEPVFVFKK